MTEPESVGSRYLRLGLRTMGIADLLSVMATDDLDQAQSVVAKATQILALRGVNGLHDLSAADLHELGLEDEGRQRSLLAAVELGRRIGLSNKGERKTISRSRDVAELFSYLRDENQEHFCALFLNTKNGILGMRTIHMGTVASSIVGPREVYREALRIGASGVIVVHNHPSGDPTPSPEDHEATQALKEAGKVIHIDLLDHVIIGHNSHFSFREKKHL